MPSRSGVSSRAKELAAEQLVSAPESLLPTQRIARVVSNAGQHLYSVEVLDGDSTPTTHLVELPTRFRSTIWIKRGGLVVIDLPDIKERKNKIEGDIAYVVLKPTDKDWTQKPFWPDTLQKVVSNYSEED